MNFHLQTCQGGSVYDTGIISASVKFVDHKRLWTNIQQPDPGASSLAVGFPVCPKTLGLIEPSPYVV